MGQLQKACYNQQKDGTEKNIGISAKFQMGQFGETKMMIDSLSISVLCGKCQRHVFHVCGFLQLYMMVQLRQDRAGRRNWSPL